MTADRFDDLMSAISFAEAGEHEKAREFLKGRNTILLAVSDRFLDDNVLKYSLNMSRRIGACIDILYLSKSGSRDHILNEFMSAAGRDGIACRLLKTDGCMKKAILDYTARKKEISFVVVGSTPELDIECRTGEKSLSDAWKRLKCPLVVVSKGDLPSLA
ncbi:MAG: hypothetical protein M0Z79_12465 [Nitrospiraceae bacterium]|nr:hypothetical protein [Nitrospiraceae bacterium]